MSMDPWFAHFDGGPWDGVTRVLKRPDRFGLTFRLSPSLAGSREGSRAGSRTIWTYRLTVVRGQNLYYTIPGRPAPERDQTGSSREERTIPSTQRGSPSPSQTALTVADRGG